MTAAATDELYRNTNSVAPLGIIAMPGAEQLAKKINDYLVSWANDNGFPDQSYLIECECPRFASGDGKGLIKSTIRGLDLYIVIDVGNYSCTYKMFDRVNSMSPDDHYQDLKRIIEAASGKAHRLNIIMPLLYGGRQHRRNYRESLDCAVALQELQAMGVENIVTFDAHDPRVSNAVPLMGIDNVIPSYQVLKTMLRAFPNLDMSPEKFMVISPDEGALGRNMYYASVLGVNLGMFYKRRDYSRVVDGKNPIVAHEYLGNPVEGKTVFVADDIIASGGSILDLAQNLKARKAERIIAYATYGLFTHGLEAFDKAYEDGTLHAVFGTNLTYRMPALLERPWFHEVDVSKYAAYFIAAINHDVSITKVINPHDKIQALLAKQRAMK
ncbi:MAG: ribose-phosphate pyrophosphokinase [Oscillospiraceae bacterium]|nr:ribose-phosphate pyrophosphokinase [Oscillospiraceae bacterium]